jgi:hypothetical protein
MTEPKIKIGAKLLDDREHLQKYKAGDMLPAAEAADVVSENSGHPVSATYLSKLVARGWISKHKFGPVLQYPYVELRDLVVSQSNAGPKFKKDVSPGAERVRKTRAKKRAAAAVEEES